MNSTASAASNLAAPCESVVGAHVGVGQNGGGSVGECNPDGYDTPLPVHSHRDIVQVASAGNGHAPNGDVVVRHEAVRCNEKGGTSHRETLTQSGTLSHTNSERRALRTSRVLGCRRRPVLHRKSAHSVHIVAKEVAVHVKHLATIGGGTVRTCALDTLDLRIQTTPNCMNTM
jgi:hypothetical protein